MSLRGKSSVTGKDDKTAVVREASGAQLVEVVSATGGDASAGSAGTSRSASVPTTAPTAGSLMAANASRKRLVIKNDGANDVWINFGGVATATAGGDNFRIPALGGYLEDRGYTGSLSAIAVTAAVALYAREY